MKIFKVIVLIMATLLIVSCGSAPKQSKPIYNENELTTAKANFRNALSNQSLFTGYNVEQVKNNDGNYIVKLTIKVNDNWKSLSSDEKMTAIQYLIGKWSESSTAAGKHLEKKNLSATILLPGTGPVVEYGNSKINIIK
jgi:hypothetical protein